MKFFNDKKCVITFIICQVLAIICLSFLIIERTVKSPDEFYFFGRVLQYGFIYFIAAIGFIEWIFLILIAIYRKKYRRILWSILILPVLIVCIISPQFFGEYSNTYEVEVPSLEQKLVITNQSFFQYGDSLICKKTGPFRVQRMGTFSSHNSNRPPLLTNATFLVKDNLLFVYSSIFDDTQVYQIEEEGLTLLLTYDGPINDFSEDMISEVKK